MMYYINNMQLMSYISVITNFAGIAVLILMPFIIHRFDSLKLVIIGRFILVLSFVLCLFTNPNRMAFLFAGIVLQKVSEGFTSVSPAVNARLVDHLEYKNGIRPIHLVNALNLSTARISTLVSNVFILGAGSQTHATNAAVAAELGKTSYYMYLAIPCILSAIIAIITLFFDLTDKKVNSMRSEIIENNRPQISD
jgi:Na+/melibiose symporter and related transporters